MNKFIIRHPSGAVLGNEGKWLVVFFDESLKVFPCKRDAEEYCASHNIGTEWYIDKFHPQF